LKKKDYCSRSCLRPRSLLL